MSCIGKTCANNLCKDKTPITGQGGKKLTGVETRIKGKTKRQKKSMDAHCDCCTKSSKKSESKPSHDEKKSPEIFESVNGSWNDCLPPDYKSKIEKFYPSDQPKTSDRSDKLLYKNFLELERKVDFLIQVFKDYGHKITDEGPAKQCQFKSEEDFFEEVWHLFKLNKRMCAAEEGIEKLALIMEEILKDTPKRKDSSLDENSPFSNELEFEQMTIFERINFLKNRNDLLMGFMKIFLRVDSFEEVLSRLASRKDEEKQMPPASNLCYYEKSQTKELNREEIMDTLKKLRMQMRAVKEMNNQENKQMSRSEKEDQIFKYSGNKLEVISEQAEFDLNQNDSNKIGDHFKTSTGARISKVNSSAFSHENNGFRSDLSDTTSKLLVQEALLKSSLDKVHFDLLSKLDTAEKNILKASIANHFQLSTKDDDAIYDFDSNFDILSDVSFSGIENDEIFEKETVEKEKKKEETASLEVDPINTSKGNLPCGKGVEGKSEEKSNKYPAKIPGNARLESPPKVNRPRQSIPELCSSRYGRSNAGGQKGDQRPVTAPVSERKSSAARSSLRNSFRSSAQGDATKKKSEINDNVRNKNKILLNKKSNGRTS